MIKRLFYFTLVIFLFEACNTKFSVNGDAVETPVVLFLLDQGETYHFLKLNKTFLKEGNAKVFAKDPSNSYFDDVVATVTEVKNGNEVKTWTLQDTTINNKKPGVFYYPNQKLYYFKEANLDPDAVYRLKIVIDGGAHVVTGQTKLIQDLSITNPKPNISYRFAENDVNIDGYRPTSIRFVPSTDAAVYDVTLQFDYEEYTATDSTLKSLYWDLGELSSTDVEQTTPSLTAQGEAFYDFLKNSIENDPAVVKRHVRGITTILTAGSQDFYTYMLSNQPATSTFVQNKHTYTNLEGAIGIFSSRCTVKQYKPYFAPPFTRCLDINSTKELCTGQYTVGLKFCDDILADNSYPFYCGN